MIIVKNFRFLVCSVGIFRLKKLKKFRRNVPDSACEIPLFRYTPIFSVCKRAHFAFLVS